jgi:hypothetical protein
VDQAQQLHLRAALLKQVSVETGSVDWQTTIKTGDFTAVSGEGYFINTTSGTITMTLPSSPSAGDIVALKDYANTFDTNNLTIGRNGSNISGEAADSIISVEGQALTIVYGDATKGWQAVAAATDSDLPKPAFVAASGGNSTATSPCGNFKIHTFTGPGTFTVSCAGNSSGSNELEYIVVAGGGGGGGQYIGGGGGAGGLRFASPSLAPATYPAKPLAAPAAITAVAQAFPISVGGGGTGNASAGNTDSTRGVSSTFSTITSTGGGAGKQDQGPGNNTGQPGGSGGGGSGGAPGDAPEAYLKGSGNTPPVTPPQGNDGGNGGAPGSPAPGSGPGAPYVAGGGGGALGVGGCAVRPTKSGGAGGVGGGFPNAFGTSGQNCGSFYYFAGGGGGNASQCSAPSPNPGPGGLGGGGAGVTNANATAGTANTGGGGGGTDTRSVPANAGGGGGSGIVIIRYKFQ